MGGIRFAVIIYFLYTLFVELIQGELETNSVQPEAKTGSKSYPFLIGTAPNEQTIRKKAPPDAVIYLKETIIPSLLQLT